MSVAGCKCWGCNPGSVPSRGANVEWRFCPACKSYRYQWSPATGAGRCSDCGYVRT